MSGTTREASNATRQPSCSAAVRDSAPINAR
jgi:hypothetical protein